MACRSVLLALAVLAAVACAQSRELLAGGKMSGGMQQQSKESDDAVFSRGRATSGEAYLAANAVQFDTLPAQVDVDQFRNTVASFFKLETSQVLINRVYPLGSGSAVDFFALFSDDDEAEDFESALADPQRLHAVFAAAPALSNPRLVPAGAADGSASSPMMAPMMNMMATAGAGGAGVGGAGGQASGEGASPGSPGVGTPGAPGTVTTSGGG